MMKEDPASALFLFVLFLSAKVRINLERAKFLLKFIKKIFFFHSTLKCYFEGKKELFKGLAIDKLEKEWKQYPVSHLDFNGNNFTRPGVLEQTLKSFVERQEAIYGKDEYSVTLGDRFLRVK